VGGQKQIIPGYYEITIQKFPVAHGLASDPIKIKDLPISR
jgi:hypothetical protein